MSFYFVKYISRWQSVGTLSLRFFRKALFSELWNKAIFPHLFMQVCCGKISFYDIPLQIALYGISGRKSTRINVLRKQLMFFCLNRSILYDLEEYIKQSAVNVLFIPIFVHGDSFVCLFVCLFVCFFIPKAWQQIMNFNHINFFSKLIELFNCPP